MQLIEKLFFPIFLIGFTLAMIELFLKFADYIGANGF